MLLLAGWLYVSNLQHSVEDLRAQNVELAAEKRQLEKNAIALADEMKAAEARAVAYQTIKETVNEAPSGAVPADIRAALDGLRHLRSNG